MKRLLQFLIATVALLPAAAWSASTGPQIAEGQALTGAAGPPSASVQESDDRQRFDCYAAAPHSHWYEIGAYREALKEIEPLAKDGCAPAEHLLAVMYGMGQGVRQDPVRAYAWLLVAFSMGVTPFGGGAGVPVLAEDPSEFEIVQFGARLSDEQLARADELASRLVNPRAIAANGAIGPTGIADAIRELRPRRAGYSLNGKLATLEPTNALSSLLAKANRGGPSGALAQLVTAANGASIPHQLAFIDAELTDLARGVSGSDQDLQRELDLAADQGERFERLEIGLEVRIARFGVNAGFASQVEPVAAAGTNSTGQKYWVDSCFLKMKDPRDAGWLSAARGDKCEKPR
jgi:TPR repeat protein